MFQVEIEIFNDSLSIVIFCKRIKKICKFIIGFLTFYKIFCNRKDGNKISETIIKIQ